MIWEIEGRLVQLVDPIFLLLFSLLLDFKLAYWVYLLIVEVRWHLEFFLLEVLFVLLYVEWVVY